MPIKHHAYCIAVSEIAAKRTFRYNSIFVISLHTVAVLDRVGLPHLTNYNYCGRVIMKVKINTNTINLSLL